MDYVPVYEDQAQPAGAAIAGLAPVVLNQQSLDLAGIQTAVATTGQIERVIRTVGTVVPDETRVRHVHTRVSGFIQKLYVNYTGQLVKKGEPILEIYSPELLASQQEFIRALETARQFANSSIPEVRQGGRDLVNSSRRRLELFDVPASFIEKLETTGQAQRTVTLVAPVSGYLTAKNVYEGHQVEPGMELFTITDLSRVWIMADIYEYEVSSVRLGQMATLRAAYDPSVQLNARIAFISPTLNADSRTLRVRFDAPNARLALKPDMYVNVELQVNGGEGVAFPDSAVLDTGTRQIVFVETAPGRFEPRQVHVTNRAAGMVQVDSGVAAGERVVVKANFLLDSESRLTAAISGANARQQGGGAP
jgi:RND family efflux transporter MFP subunit